MIKQGMIRTPITTGIICTLRGGYAGPWPHIQNTGPWEKAEKESFQYTKQAVLQRVLRNIPGRGFPLSLFRCLIIVNGGK